jgi:hypothetical protein
MESQVPDPPPTPVLDTVLLALLLLLLWLEETTPLPPAPAPALPPAPPLLLSLEHAATKAQEETTAANTQDFMITPPKDPSNLVWFAATAERRRPPFAAFAGVGPCGTKTRVHVVDTLVQESNCLRERRQRTRTPVPTRQIDRLQHKPA